VGQRPVFADGLAVDPGGPPGFKTDVQPRGFTHVASLAGDALLLGGRRPVLFPDGFELDAGMDLDLVAGGAELRFGDDVGLYRRLMDAEPLGPVRLVRPVGLVEADEEL